MHAMLNLGGWQQGVGIAGMASEGDNPLLALHLSPEPPGLAASQELTC